MSQDDEGKATWRELVASVLLFRGLRLVFDGSRIGTMVRAWKCKTCQEWAGYYRGHGQTIPLELIAKDANVASVDENGLCEHCAGDEIDGGILAYAARRGVDEHARNPANYTVSMLITAYMYENGLLKPKGNA